MTTKRHCLGLAGRKRTIHQLDDVKDSTNELKKRRLNVTDDEDDSKQRIAKLTAFKAKYNVNKDGSVTFHPTPNCKPSAKKLIATKLNIDAILEKENCQTAIMYSNKDVAVIQDDQSHPCDLCSNSFVTSALMAWSEHYPFKFRAEHIWLLILQSVAIHVEQNAEKLRPKYVKHNGKKILEIKNVPGIPSLKDWEAIIQIFAQMIDENTVDDVVKLFDCDFTTSTLTEKIATKITIMDICKSYFDYL